MLPPAIKGQVVETELNVNTTEEFVEGAANAGTGSTYDLNGPVQGTGSTSESVKGSNRFNSQGSSSTARKMMDNLMVRSTDK
jgi:hypothetical protein